MNCPIKIMFFGLLSISFFCVAHPASAKNTVLARRGGGPRGGARGGRRAHPARRPAARPVVRTASVHTRHVTRTVSVRRVYRLPGACITRKILNGINYYYCGGVYYRPYYEGTTVVYNIETP